LVLPDVVHPASRVAASANEAHAATEVIRDFIIAAPLVVGFFGRYPNLCKMSMHKMNSRNANVFENQLRTVASE
jgi:hypothetical protein